MLEININVKCPDLLLATTALAAALKGKAPAEDTASVTAPAAPVAANPTPAPVGAMPATTGPATNAYPSSQPGYVPAGAPPIQNTVPTAAPAYSVDQIAKAGAELAQAGKMPQLMGLLQQFGVQAVTQLPPEQYGPFAAALRGLGAQL